MKVAFAEIIANSEGKRGEKDLRRFAFTELDRSGGIRIDDRFVFVKCAQLRDQVPR